MSNCNNKQTELFTDNELEQLQGIIITNYSEIVQNNLLIPEKEIEEEEIVVVDTESIRLGEMQSNLIPDAEIKSIQEIEQQKLQQLHDKANKEAQEKLDLPFFPIPKDDNQELLNLQYRYIKFNDEIAWGLLLELSYAVTKRILWNWLKTHKDTFLDPIGQDEKTSEAMYYVLRRYKENIGWHVKSNYIGALKGGVLHVMRYHTKLDENTIVTDDVNKFRSGGINAKHQNST